MMRATAEPQVIPSDRFGSWARFAVPLGTALVLLPLLVAAISTLAHDAPTPIRDQALMEMRVRDVGVHAVYLGLYSRDGWSHVGPLVFYTLAIPYRIFGNSTAGMVVGALVVNGVSIVAMVAISRRLAGRRVALVMLLFASVLVRALGASLVANPWVLFITVLPFGVFCCVIWALLVGKVWALPVGAGLASWLVQTHVGYAPLAVPMLGAGAMVLGATTWRSADTRRAAFLRAVALTAGVLLIAWVLPVWDQVDGTGNFMRAARWFREAKEGVHTLGEGVRVVGAQFAVVPDWITGTRRVSPFNGETLLRDQMRWPILLVPFAAALVVARRRRLPGVLALGVVVMIATGLGIVAVARTIGIMYEYRMLWTWVVGGLGGVVITWTIWERAAARFHAVDRFVVVTAMITLAALCGVEVVQAITVARADWNSASTATAVRQLSKQLDRRGGQVLLRSETPSSEWYLQGVLLALAKQGFPARVRGLGGGLYPEDLSAGPGPNQASLEVVAGPELAKLTPSQLTRIVAYGGPLPLAKELSALRASVARSRRLLDDLEAHRIGGDEFRRRQRRLPQYLETAVVVLRDRAG